MWKVMAELSAKIGLLTLSLFVVWAGASENLPPTCDR